MDGFGNQVKSNLKARMDNVKGTVQGTVDNFKTLFGDVKTRFDLSPDKEPPSPKALGGLVGQRGDLSEVPLALAVREKDILAKHVQTFASINRRWVNK